MIAVARELGDCGWIVNPSEAADIIQPRLSLSEASLCSLSHRLARVHERPSSAAARVIDNVVVLAGQRLQEWEFRKRMRKFKDDALARIDLSSPGCEAVIDRETEAFLRGEGIVRDATTESELATDAAE